MYKVRVRTALASHRDCMLRPWTEGTSPCMCPRGEEARRAGEVPENGKERRKQLHSLDCFETHEHVTTIG